MTAPGTTPQFRSFPHTPIGTAELRTSRVQGLSGYLNQPLTGPRPAPCGCRRPRALSRPDGREIPAMTRFCKPALPLDSNPNGSFSRVAHLQNRQSQTRQHR